MKRTEDPATSWTPSRSLGRSLSLIAIALLIALAAAPLTAQPAQAQSTPAHCDSSDLHEIWCATMTAGTSTLGGVTTGYGFSGSSSPTVGSLTDEDFSYQSTTYTIKDLGRSVTPAVELVIILDPSGSTVFNTGGFTLIAGSREFSFADATYNSTTNGFVWTNTGLTWSDSDTITLKLSTNNAPTVANAIPNQTATVNNTFSYTFPANTFADSDNDPLSYDAVQTNGTTLPSWLSFNAATRTFSGTPRASDACNLTIRTTADDGYSGVTYGDFNIQVIPNANSACRLVGFKPISDISDGPLFPELQGASDVTAVEINNRHYAVVVARTDNGVQIIDITDPYAPSAVASITDGTDYPELEGAGKVEVIESQTDSTQWSPQG